MSHLKSLFVPFIDELPTSLEIYQVQVLEPIFGHTGKYAAVLSLVDGPRK